MARVELDLNELVSDGRLSAEEASRLSGLKIADRRADLLINLLQTFGAIAITMGALPFLDGNRWLLLVWALSVLALATALQRLKRFEAFAIASTAFSIIGTLGMAVWILQQLAYSGQDLMTTIIITAFIGVGAAWFRSAFLSSFCLIGFVGIAAFLVTTEAAEFDAVLGDAVTTIAAFGTLALILYKMRDWTASGWKKLLTVPARISVLIVFGVLWYWSLFGEHLGDFYWTEAARNKEPGAWKAWSETAIFIPAWAFIIAGVVIAITLITTTRRGGFLSVSSIVLLCFGAFTQYFRYLGFNSGSLLFAGLALVGLAFGIAWFWKQARKRQGAEALEPRPATSHI